MEEEAVTPRRNYPPLRIFYQQVVYVHSALFPEDMIAPASSAAFVVESNATSPVPPPPPPTPAIPVMQASNSSFLSHPAGSYGATASLTFMSGRRIFSGNPHLSQITAKDPVLLLHAIRQLVVDEGFTIAFTREFKIKCQTSQVCLNSLVLSPNATPLMLDISSPPTCPPASRCVHFTPPTRFRVLAISICLSPWKFWSSTAIPFVQWS